MTDNFIKLIKSIVGSTDVELTSKTLASEIFTPRTLNELFADLEKNTRNTIRVKSQTVFDEGLNIEELQKTIKDSMRGG